MIKTIKALIKSIKKGRQHYKTMKAMGLYGGKDIQGEAAIWMVYIADHSPLSIADMIAYDLYSFARVHRHSKEDIINIACRIGSDPENIIRLLNEGDMECINIMGIKEFKEILFEQKTWCLIELSHRTKLSEDEVSKMLLKSLSYTDAKGKLSIPFVLSMNTELRPDGVYITPEWYDEQLTKLNVH